MYKLHFKSLNRQGIHTFLKFFKAIPPDDDPAERLRSVLSDCELRKPPDVALDLILKLESELKISVKLVGVSATVRLCDEYLRSEVKCASLHSFLLSFLNRYPEELGQVCESCISLTTSDTVACGASRGKKIFVVISKFVTLDIELGEFCDEWTGCRVWPGAFHLSRMMIDNRFSVQGQDVLELGTGVGVSGIACMHAGARSVAFTECQPRLLDVALANAFMNEPSNTEICYRGFILDWIDFVAKSHEDFAVFRESCRNREFTVIGSEVVYDESHTDPILNVLDQLFQNGASRALIVVMLKPLRNGVESFLKRLSQISSRMPFHFRTDIEQTVEGNQAACISFYSNRRHS